MYKEPLGRTLLGHKIKLPQHFLGIRNCKNIYVYLVADFQKVKQICATMERLQFLSLQISDSLPRLSWYAIRKNINSTFLTASMIKLSHLHRQETVLHTLASGTMKHREVLARFDKPMRTCWTGGLAQRGTGGWIRQRDRTCGIKQEEMSRRPKVQR